MKQYSAKYTDIFSEPSSFDSNITAFDKYFVHFVPSEVATELREKNLQVFEFHPVWPVSSERRGFIRTLFSFAGSSGVLRTHSSQKSTVIAFSFLSGLSGEDAA